MKPSRSAAFLVLLLCEFVVHWHHALSAPSADSTWFERAKKKLLFLVSVSSLSPTTTSPILSSIKSKLNPSPTNTTNQIRDRHRMDRHRGSRSGQGPSQGKRKPKFPPWSASSSNPTHCWSRTTSTRVTTSRSVGACALPTTPRRCSLLPTRRKRK